MSIRKLAGWAVVIFIAYFLFTNPTGAAHAATAGFNILKQAGNAIGTFLGKL